MEDQKVVNILPDDEEDETLVPSILCLEASNDRPISIDTYEEDLALQKALIASISSPPLPFNHTVINFSDEESEPTAKPFTNHSITVAGQSSNSSPATIICKICMEPISASECFTIPRCSHVFCLDCLSKYVASKIQENVSRVKCPEVGCYGMLEPEFCQDFLPLEVFERWGLVLCESLILGSMKFYCPFKDCSALLLDEGGCIVESECPHCRRLFCAQCKVPWHSGIECAEFQKLEKGEREREDIMLMKLANEKEWKRCPMCRFYVERSMGCLFMRCRCGHCFCYSCGATTLKDHYCSKCNR